MLHCLISECTAPYNNHRFEIAITTLTALLWSVTNAVATAPDGRLSEVSEGQISSEPIWEKCFDIRSSEILINSKLLEEH